MRNFGYSRPLDIAEAIGIEQRQADTKYLGGGTNLVDLMKMGVERPSHLVDITRLPLAQIEAQNGGVKIGAMVRNSEVAAHPEIRRKYPVLSQAILAGASAQIRNMATTGGNLLQRTRCCYFYDPSYAECVGQRTPPGCAKTLETGRTILGVSDQCIATYPGDMAVALTALDARVLLRGPQGERSVSIEQFYRLPGSAPHVENELKPGELIVAVELPPATANLRSAYLKIRDRRSYAFALVSVAVVLDIGPDNRIRAARIALGSVAPKPWRVKDAENTLCITIAYSEPIFRRAAADGLRRVRTAQQRFQN